MLDFAIIALPRSGTTWAANWMTTKSNYCLHDPLATYTFDDLAKWGDMGAGFHGVSCTMLWAFPEWVKNYVRRWVILERPIDEIQASLAEIGLPPINEKMYAEFKQMPGLRVDWKNLFEPEAAKEIYNHLLPIGGFDAERHKVLRELHITPRFEAMQPRKEACLDLIRRIRACLETQSEPPAPT